MRKCAITAITAAFTVLLLVPAAAPAKKVKFSALSENFADVTFGAKGKKKDGEFKPEAVYLRTIGRVS